MMRQPILFYETPMTTTVPVAPIVLVDVLKHSIALDRIVIGIQL